MFRGQLGGGGVRCADELRVVSQLLEHPDVFAANWAVHYRRTTALSNCSSRANAHRAVDDGHRRLEKVDIASGFPYKILNLKRKTDVKHVHVLDPLLGRFNVHADHIVVLAGELK